MKNKLGNASKLLQGMVKSDLRQLRTKIFIYVFNAFPDLYLLYPLKNTLLFLGGAKIHILGNYIKSPFYCTRLSNLEIGNGNFINIGAYIDSSAKVVIGNGNQIGPFLRITTTNHDIFDSMKNINLPVCLENNIWIGTSVVINPGVRISPNIIVASGAVASKNLDKENGLYTGVPAVLKRTLR